MKLKTQPWECRDVQLGRPPAGPHFPRLKLQHHETMLAQISAIRTLPAEFWAATAALITGALFAAKKLRARKPLHEPLLTRAAPGPKVTDPLPPRNGQCNRSHMPNRPCLCGCNACNGPIPLWPPPLQTFVCSITPINPDQTASKPIKLHQTELPTLPNSDT